MPLPRLDLPQPLPRKRLSKLYLNCLCIKHKLLAATGALSWTAMATVVTTPTGAVVATIVGSLSTACSDVVVDSIVVERSRGAPQVCTPPFPLLHY